MAYRARSKVETWLGLAGLLLGASACADDAAGASGGTASSSGGSSSSSAGSTGSTGPGATSLATGADTTAGVVTSSEGTSSSGPGSTDGTSSSGGSSGGSTTRDATTTDSSSGSSSGGAAVCGDGVAQPGEQCDTGDFQGFDCVSLGFGPGLLFCDLDQCTFDTSSCSVPGNCGNGVIDAAEQCDGGDLQGFDCASLGLGGGTLGCDAATCTFDISMCGGGGNCGNGIIDPGEQCDGANLQGFDCASLGLAGGTLGCDPITCTFDTSMCLGGGGTSG